MKILYRLIPLTLLLSGCLTNYEYVVESDYSYRGKFKNYRTFSFVEMAGKDSVEMINQPLIEKAISSRMRLQGYRFKDDRPNLYVFYKIFYDDVRYNGFNQPDIEDWIRYEDENEEYKPIKYNLRQGTLVIQLMDRKRKQTVWQGYASGLFNIDYRDNDKVIKRAISSIFDRYRFFVENTDFQ